MKARRRSLSRYIPSWSDRCTHFEIGLGETHRGFEALPCLLARAWASGNFELLSPAWSMLGYSTEELAGRCVGELIALEPAAARAAVRSLLNEGSWLEFGLRCKDGREIRVHWSRHFDDFTTSLFIVGDVLRAARRRIGAVELPRFPGRNPYVFGIGQTGPALNLLQV
ncbi:MAG: hypothetical protein EPO20_21370 [Betaproteobacteria bacterium]|nr:MAG: hypothetical protein EPO20_21370 [Betaproteobacteria bacterium]